MSAWKIGENYLIRTVTMALAGKMVEVGEHELVLEDAAWIADTGRFSSSLISCEFHEVEMFPAGRQVLVGRAAVIDAVTIDTLPTVSK